MGRLVAFCMFEGVNRSVQKTLGGGAYLNVGLVPGGVIAGIHGFVKATVSAGKLPDNVRSTRGAK